MKKITVINGIDDSHADFVQELNSVISKSEQSFETFNLKDMDIKYCCGCWVCWLKTPGKCVHQDEMPLILKSIINSDLTVFISPIRMGFVSANIKKAMDKIIPLAHPYVEIYNGECHHVKRYERYPKLGLVLIDETQDRGSYEIISSIYQRLAINLQTELAFSILSDGSLEEVGHAINNF